MPTPIGRRVDANQHETQVPYQTVHTDKFWPVSLASIIPSGKLSPQHVVNNGQKVSIGGQMRKNLAILLVGLRIKYANLGDGGEQA